MIASKEDLSQPFFVYLPESGKLSFMFNSSLGLKLMFEHAHQSLVGIEIFMIGETLKKRMQYII